MVIKTHAIKNLYFAIVIAVGNAPLNKKQTGRGVGLGHIIF